MALPAVTMVVQWGVSNVYKVGGKVFANADNETISFKASEIAYEALVEDERGRRVPTLNRAPIGLTSLSRIPTLAPWWSMRMP